MSEDASRDDAHAIESAAAGWLVRLTSGEMAQAELDALQVWLQADPEHRRQFQAMQSIWIHAPSREALSMNAAQMGDEQWRDASVQPSGAVVRRRRVPALPFAAAAALVLTVLGVLLFVDRPQYTAYSTAIGEQRTLTVADGSVVNLNTDSHLDLRLTQDRRTVRLHRGEAFFSVHPEPERPFAIEVEDGVIEVVGTRFNVRRAPGYFSVEVIEGVVRVQLDASLLASAPPPTRLSAGEQLIYRRDGGGALVNRAAARGPPAWVDGKLRFEQTPLSVAIAEANRYLQQPVVLADGPLGEVRVSGVFFIERIDEMVEILEEEGVVRVERADDGRSLHLYAP